MPTPSPRPLNGPITDIFCALEFAPETAHTYEAVHHAAVEIAAAKRIAATPAEIDGAANLYLFACLVKAGDLRASGVIADRVFETAIESTMYFECHRDWVEKLVAASRFETADVWTHRLLEYLAADDQSVPFVRNRVLFLVELVLDHAAVLHRSYVFIGERWPDTLE